MMVIRYLLLQIEVFPTGNSSVHYPNLKRLFIVSIYPTRHIQLAKFALGCFEDYSFLINFLIYGYLPGIKIPKNPFKILRLRRDFIELHK